jgi:hypothetical protein
MSSEPMKPLAPVTRMRISADDDAGRRYVRATLGKWAKIDAIVTGT